MADSLVTVIIPCFNEENRLRPGLFTRFLQVEPAFNFLFVDDGSRDNTLERLEEIRAASPGRVEILRLERNLGKAEAVRRGFLRGMQFETSYLAFWDADLATPLETLPSFLGVFLKKPGVEIVLGSRVKLLGHDIRRNECRHYLGRVFATSASLALGVSVYDTQCGAKMFRNTPLVRGLFKESFLSRWIFDVELLMRYLRDLGKTGEARASESLYELPLPVWHDVAGTKLKPFDFVRAFFELVRIKLSYL